jgi:hypothetical protein
MRMRFAAIAAALLVAVTLPLAQAASDKKPGKDKDPLVKPMAGPRACSLRVAWLYVSPDLTSQKVDKVQIGREMVVAERSGTWLRVYANTDIELVHDKDTPIFGEEDSATPPISGWMESKGVLIETTPNGDQVLMGEAASQEQLAQDPRGPLNAAPTARLLYRRLVEMFPSSPLVPEAAWRAADIQWQIQKQEAATRPSAREKASYLRDQMDEEEMKKLLKRWPGSKQADYAAYALIDNKLCGDWQGEPKCPAKESEYYEKFAQEHPDGPRTAQALYQATWRQAVLNDMYAADGKDGKAAEARQHAQQLAARLREKFPQSDSAARASSLVFKLEQGIAVYGIDRQ